MKKIAFYLPQFHEIEENNTWWGEGFTEWTNVKKSKALYSGHNQPRVPFEKTYYNLDDVSVMQQQAELASRYGIDAFCFYHYYFKDGKTLLEKPLSNFLKSEINKEYCFCWANESWTRNWDGKDREVLIEQDYGELSAWKAHFNYMLKFFLDARYIKHHGKPVFLIYKIEDIPNFLEFSDCWNDMAKNNGFEGVEFISIKRHKEKENKCNEYSNVSYRVAFEPFYSLSSTDSLSKYYKYGSGAFRKVAIKAYDLLTEVSSRVGFRKRFTINYSSIVSRSISNQKEFSQNLIPGCFVDWDNSPRRGNKGIIFDGFSIHEFENYAYQTVKFGRDNNKPFIFINAWNEWAEGTYLEPDEKYGFSVLESFKRASDRALKE